MVTEANEAGALSDPEEPSAAPTRLQGSAAREESEDYGRVLAVLNSTLRVICGKCNIQWIAQDKVGRRVGPVMPIAEPRKGCFGICRMMDMGVIPRPGRSSRGCRTTTQNERAAAAPPRPPQPLPGSPTGQQGLCSCVAYAIRRLRDHILDMFCLIAKPRGNIVQAIGGR